MKDIFVAFILSFILFISSVDVSAQGSYTPFEGEVIRNVTVKFINPGSDTTFLSNLKSKVIRNFDLYPSEKFS